MYLLIYVAHPPSRKSIHAIEKESSQRSHRERRVRHLPRSIVRVYRKERKQEKRKDRKKEREKKRKMENEPTNENDGTIKKKKK